MLKLYIDPTPHENLPNPIEVSSLEEKILLLIIRDLRRIGWAINFSDHRIELAPPLYYNKNVIRQSMSIKRQEIISKNCHWIDNHIQLARDNLASGFDVLGSKFIPEIEVCESQKQHDLFRILRFYWSSSYSEYVGRRIKVIFRDGGLPSRPVIGIAALGSPIIHIPERDDYIGWDIKQRTQNINYMMDAYIIGALPPYNYLLGGKLISLLLASNEVREIFEYKYKNSKYEKIAGIFTTSLYGRSSQYNRIKIAQSQLYHHIGETKGFGTLHLTAETFKAMLDFLKIKGIVVGNRFGNGPVWTMRVIRTAGELLGFDTDELLNHSFKRSIYYVPFAKNTIQFLRGETKKLSYNKYSMKYLASFWKERWLNERKKRYKTIEDVKWFSPETFEI